MRIVIIGNGVAGIEAALVVREREPGWDLTIVSEESDHFFSRTALMYVLSGQLSHRDIEPYERDLYERLRIRRVRARATGIDVAAQQVRLAGGLDALPYDRLLIAVGSRPRKAPWPGADLRGVGHFVTLQDLEWLERELHGGPSRGGRPPRADAHTASAEPTSPYRARGAAAEARGRTARSAVVVGGGLIGSEVVETLVAARVPTHFVVREEWFWPIALDAIEARWVATEMRRHDVSVHLGDELERFVGDDAGVVRAVRTKSGEEIACDVAVVAIGVVPNTDWLADSGIERAAPNEHIERDRAGGIVVDARLSTTAPNVLAAGDCASVLWFDGARRPEQLWYTAREQGRIAGRRLCGDDTSYARGTMYNSAKLMDIEYTTVGLVNFEIPGERSWLYEEEGRVRSTTRVVVKDGHVIGFNALGRRWDHSVIARWIEERRSIDFVLDHLGEAAFDTELVPPLVVPESARASIAA